MFPLGAIASYYIDAPSCERVVRLVVGGARRTGSSSGGGRRFLARTGEAEGSCELDSWGIGKGLMGLRRRRAKDAEHTRVVGDCDRVERRDVGEGRVKGERGRERRKKTRRRPTRDRRRGECCVGWGRASHELDWEAIGSGGSELPRGRPSRRADSLARRRRR